MKVFNKKLVEWLTLSFFALILAYAISYKFVNIHGDETKETHPFQEFVIK